MSQTATPAAALAATAGKPEWVSRLDGSYRLRGKHLVVLTGNVRDLHWSPEVQRFVSLEQALYQASQKGFLPVKFDAANGITFFDEKDRNEFVKAVQQSTTAQNAAGTPADIGAQIEATRRDAVVGLTLLRECAEAVANARLRPENAGKYRRLLILSDSPAALFPAGDFDRLGEDDRRKLVSFLGWVGSPLMAKHEHLIVLVSDTKAELNNRLFGLPETEQIEIELPNDDERGRFIRSWLIGKEVEVEAGPGGLMRDTAGIKLVTIEDLLEGAAAGKTPLTRAAVHAEVNKALVAELGDIVKVRRPTHTLADVVGQRPPVNRLLQTLKRCEDPRTAISGAMLTGANGSGKTFLAEACSVEAGWIILVLSGLRDKWFGETDRRFEKLQLVLRRFGRVIMYVEEAKATLGSVHRDDVHETERRLMGLIIGMMSNKQYLGRVFWLLDTSRADGLDPDIQRRCPVQIAVFDPEGDERKAYVRELLSRNGLSCSDDDLAKVLASTESYSASDYGVMVTLAKGDDTSVLQVLEYWRPPDISEERSFQALIAAIHCTYRDLLPPSLRDKSLKDMRMAANEYKVLKGI